MQNLKEKFQRFMIGRYGADQLGRFLSIVIVILVWLIDPQCADHPFGNSLFSDFFPEHYQAQSGK